MTKLIIAFLLVILSIAIIFAIPTKFEGPLLIYINKIHEIRLVDMVGLLIGIPAWLYINFFIINKLISKIKL